MRPGAPRVAALGLCLQALACAGNTPADPEAGRQTNSARHDQDPARRAPSCAAIPDSPATLVPGALPSSEAEIDHRSLIANNVRRVDDDHFELRRESLNTLFGHPAGIPKLARLVTVIEDGQPVGVRLVGFGPNSTLFHLGIKSGDVLQMVNDVPVLRPEDLAAAYEALNPDTDSVSIALCRGGQRLSRSYSIR